MKKIVTLLLIIGSILPETSFSQSQEIDSLKQVLKAASQDTNRVNALKKLGNLMGLNIGSYDTAIVYYNQSLALAQKLNYKKGMAGCLVNLGIVSRRQSNYPQALSYYFKAEKILSEINHKIFLSNCYIGIGQVYADQKFYPKALEYYLKAIKIKEEIGDKDGVVTCYIELGNIYGTQNHAAGLEYYLKALKIAEEIGDKIGKANCLENIGIEYKNQKNYVKALEYYSKSNQLMKELNDKPGIANTFYNLSIVNTALNFPRKAALYADSVIVLCREIGLIEGERFGYQSLAIAYDKMGNYKSAYSAQIKYQQLNDSIFNEENSKQLSDLKTNFEVEKKEAELKVEQEKKDIITNQEKQKQQMILFIVIGFLLLVAVLAGFIFKNLRQTKKQKLTIEQKEKETQQQKHIIEEKHKEITDSINYAERIQRSFLATEKQLNENLTNYFVLFKPKDVVSGDFYWSAKLSNGNFALATADSTGHGVPGAIMSLLNVTSLEKAIEHYTNPADILNHTRQTIIERLKKDGSEEGGKDGMDCSVLCFDFANKQLFIAAANNPVWIIRSNPSNEGARQLAGGDVELIEIKPDKMPVGKSDKQDQSFTTHTIELQKGDTIYTLTDGFPDQFGGPNGKKFMSKKLKELLLANVHLPITQQKKLLDSTFKKWVGDLEQVDDVTVIGIKV
jgi:serine phosphatase RsbU (regulator of sigma subunit)